MEFFQAINALLDVLDATGTVVGLVTLWYSWVVPPRIAPEPTALDLEHFLRAAATITPARHSAAAAPQATAGSSGAVRSLTP
jgi:hypothetical protein